MRTRIARRGRFDAAPFALRARPYGSSVTAIDRSGRLSSTLDGRTVRVSASVRVPWLVLVVSVTCVALHLAQIYGRALTGASLPYDPQLDLVRFGAKSVALIADAHESWRLLTAHFVHTGWLHLAFNLAFFVPVAGALETVLRRRDFALLLVVASLVSGTTSLLWTPEISAGLSGLVFAILGTALFVGLRHAKQLPDSLRLHFGWPVLPFLVLLLLAGVGNSQIDHASHFGGLVAGCALAPWLALHGTTDRAPWRMLVPATTCVLALLVAAPAIARGGRQPKVYRFGDLAQLETPAGWTAEFGPFGDVRFSGSTSLVSLSLRRVPARGADRPDEWYVREHLGALRDIGEISNVTAHVSASAADDTKREASPRRFTYERNTRGFVADVFFVHVPRGVVALTFESPLDWADKYGETREALLGSIAPAVEASPRSGRWGELAPKTACAAVCSEAESPPRP